MDIVPIETLPMEKEPIKETDNNPADNIASLCEKESSPAGQSLTKKLEGIMATMHSLSEQLENLSVEQRTQVSQTQWAILEQLKTTSDTNQKPANLWQKSLFARTYFIEIDLDESFTSVMKYTSMLYTHLKDLNGKIQCRGDGVATESNLENDNAQQTNSGTMKDLSGDEIMKIPDNLPQMISKATATINESSNEAVCGVKDVEAVRQTFTNLIRAKIEFDSQFLNFNAILSINGYSEDFHYLYEMCDNSNKLLKQTSSLSNDKPGLLGSDNKKLRRKRVSSNIVEKSQKRRLRRSTRIASDDGSAEIQIIRSLKRQRSS